jgi:hypothetical protein
MAQLSRPFQIALVALALFVLVWFVGLRRPGSTSTGSTAASGSAHPAPAHAATHAGSAAAGAHAAHGLSRAETGAVAAAHNAAQGGASSAPAAAPAAHVTRTATSSVHVARHATTAHPGTTTHAATTVHTATTTVHTQTSVSVKHHSQTSPAAAGTASPGASHKAAVAPQRTQLAQRGSAAAATSPTTPARQAAVAAELKQGKVVLILFWDPSSSIDSAVHRQVLAVAHKLGHTVAVQTATASQVGDFGSITHDIQVYQTPTLLIVNRHAQVTTVTGYTDSYAIEQTIREARG